MNRNVQLVLRLMMRTERLAYCLGNLTSNWALFVNSHHLLIAAYYKSNFSLLLQLGTIRNIFIHELTTNVRIEYVSTIKLAVIHQSIQLKNHYFISKKFKNKPTVLKTKTKSFSSTELSLYYSKKRCIKSKKKYYK